jgi:hypothetical protein
VSQQSLDERSRAHTLPLHYCCRERFDVKEQSYDDDAFSEVGHDEERSEKAAEYGFCCLEFSSFTSRIAFLLAQNVCT